jgi:YD repeat-containing protein
VASIRAQPFASRGTGVTAQGQLTSVIWQDGTRRRYHYEDARYPQGLTGITDEAGVRYATYAYQAGRVVSEQHAGGADRVDFAYNGNRTTITDYASGNATQRAYTFATQNGVYRPTAVTAPCPLCGNTQKSSTYDSAGRITRATAHDGRITFYAYDGKGRETERAAFPAIYQSATTRPALNVAESVVSTQWHATFNLPMQVAEPGKITAYAYSSQGNLMVQNWSATTDATGAAKFAGIKTGSAYGTEWGYDANGLSTSTVEKTNSVETQRWTLAYTATGDVASVVDVTAGNLLGRATQYDARGNLLSGITTLGLPLAYSYSPRGFISTRTANAKLSIFTQNAIGLTTDASLPDGQTVKFEYDATHRLTGVRLNGALLSSSAVREGRSENTNLAIAREKLRRLVESLTRPAHAQAGLPGGLMAPASVAPGMVLPGQPSAAAASVLTANDYPGDRPGAGGLPLFGRGDEAARRLAQALARFCQCDPSGGHTQPKLTAQAMAHIVISGHTGPAFVNKSYFTEPVNQALVNEVVAKDTMPDVSGAARRVYFVPDMGRAVGFKRRPDGTFVPDRSIPLVVHKDNCNNLFFVRNEVITMHPGGR